MCSYLSLCGNRAIYFDNDTRDILKRQENQYHDYDPSKIREQICPQVLKQLIMIHFNILTFCRHDWV